MVKDGNSRINQLIEFVFQILTSVIGDAPDEKLRKKGATCLIGSTIGMPIVLWFFSPMNIYFSFSLLIVLFIIFMYGLFIWIRHFVEKFNSKKKKNAISSEIKNLSPLHFAVLLRFKTNEPVTLYNHSHHLLTKGIIQRHKYLDGDPMYNTYTLSPLAKTVFQALMSDTDFVTTKKNELIAEIQQAKDETHFLYDVALKESQGSNIHYHNVFRTDLLEKFIACGILREILSGTFILSNDWSNDIKIIIKNYHQTSHNK